MKARVLRRVEPVPSSARGKTNLALVRRNLSPREVTNRVTCTRGLTRLVLAVSAWFSREGDIPITS